MFTVRWTMVIQVPRSSARPYDHKIQRGGRRTFERSREGITWAQREAEKLWTLVQALHPGARMVQVTYRARPVVVPGDPAP